MIVFGLLLLAFEGLCATDEQLVLPPLRFLPELSFSGPFQADRISNFEISGHASPLSTSHDYVRIVPDASYAYGAMFSTQQIKSKEWVAEIAFRAHTSAKKDEFSIKNKSGGRGLAFWVTKDSNPTPITIASTPNAHAARPPPTQPLAKDPSDSHVSLFGNSYSFEGLGILFDSSPSWPLYPRSEPANQFRDPRNGWVMAGAEDLPYITAIMDDKQIEQGWIDDSSKSKGAVNETEPAYSARSLADCAADFRNPNGLIWARIAHLNNKIYVDLDLTAHTTLSSVTRKYHTHCFTLDGVKIQPGYHMGISGLASANPTPDMVDIYAIEMWEVQPKASNDEYSRKMEHDRIDIAVEEEHPLEGTSKPLDGAMLGFALDLFKSQASLLDAVDALAKRIEGLSDALGQQPGNGDMGSRLKGIDTLLTGLLQKSHELPGAQIHHVTDQEGKIQEQGMNYAVQQIHKLMSDMHSLQRQVEGLQSKVSGSLSVLTSRTSEIFTLVQRANQAMEDSKTKRGSSMSQGNLGTYVIYTAAIALVGLLSRVGYKILKARGIGEQRGKKLI